MHYKIMMKRFILPLIPQILLEKYRRFNFSFNTYKQYLNFNTQYKKVSARIKGQEKINIAFYLFNADIWKADSVYRAFEDHPKFIPYVVICPQVNKGNKFLQNQLTRCIDLVNKNRYRHIIGFDGDKENLIQPKKLPNFDIVFFLNPKSHTISEFTIHKNKNSLNCYIPYSFNIDNLVQYQYNNPILNSMFRIFTSSEYHHKMYLKYSIKKGVNTFASGFPQLDQFFTISDINPWKHPKSSRKKIIWGPHWTIPDLQKTGLDWSCFIEYSDFILKIADKYKDDIEFALKPHPFLFNLLEKEENWGKIKTRNYLKEWNSRDNCQIIYGDYVDLFKHSDALIHDSGSFTVEYLCLNKPVAYTVNNENYLTRFNDIGSKAIEHHYTIKNESEFEEFVLNVIKDKDEKEQKRKMFNNVVLKADGEAGRRIVNHLEEIIK